MRLDTPKQIKEDMIWLYEGYIERLMFDREFDKYANNERQAFRVFIRRISHCATKDTRWQKMLEEMVSIHEGYRDFCDKQGAGCMNCKYRDTKGGKGACFTPYIMEQVEIDTPLTRLFESVTTALALTLVTTSMLLIILGISSMVQG